MSKLPSFLSILDPINYLSDFILKYYINIFYYNNVETTLFFKLYNSNYEPWKDICKESSDIKFNWTGFV